MSSSSSSELSSLQPSIFFMTCTLKGLLWIPFYFLPETCMNLLWGSANNGVDESDNNNNDKQKKVHVNEHGDVYHHHYEDDDDDDDVVSTAEEEGEEGEDPSIATADDAVVLQDHHFIMMERMCHYTNIFALSGMISFYYVNPRLWFYRYWGYLLLALLVLQHIPQQLFHHSYEIQSIITKLIMNSNGNSNGNGNSGSDTIEEETDTDADTTTTSMEDMFVTNRIFSTIGVIIIHSYCLYYGYKATILERLVAEPIFVYLTLLTMLLETHIVAISVWLFRTNHLMATKLPIFPREITCGTCIGLLIMATNYHFRNHSIQSKILTKQLKTLSKTDGTPKMKFV